ncbi:hypothetical protein QQP08_010191 [Theobroma cacao]|nr:hypothetical protein QQP08_010191 [Theobroma cacao]
MRLDDMIPFMLLSQCILYELGSPIIAMKPTYSEHKWSAGFTNKHGVHADKIANGSSDRLLRLLPFGARAGPAVMTLPANRSPCFTFSSLILSIGADKKSQTFFQVTHIDRKETQKICIVVVNVFLAFIANLGDTVLAQAMQRAIQRIHTLSKTVCFKSFSLIVSKKGWWLLNSKVELTSSAIANCFVFLIGFLVFRGANKQKHIFKKNPEALIYGVSLQSSPSSLMSVEQPQSTSNLKEMRDGGRRDANLWFDFQDMRNFIPRVNSTPSSPRTCGSTLSNISQC